MDENKTVKYLFSPRLMQENSFTKYEEGFGHSNPDEWTSGPVGLAVDREAENMNQTTEDNVFLGRINRMMKKLGLN